MSQEGGAVSQVKSCRWAHPRAISCIMASTQSLSSRLQMYASPLTFRLLYPFAKRLPSYRSNRHLSLAIPEATPPVFCTCLPFSQMFWIRPHNPHLICQKRRGSAFRDPQLCLSHCLHCPGHPSMRPALAQEPSSKHRPSPSVNSGLLLPLVGSSLM